MYASPWPFLPMISMWDTLFRSRQRADKRGNSNHGRFAAIRQAHSMRRDLRGRHKRMIAYLIDVLGCADEPKHLRVGKRKCAQQPHTPQRPRASRRNEPNRANRSSELPCWKWYRPTAIFCETNTTTDSEGRTARRGQSKNPPNEPNLGRIDLRKCAKRTQPPADRPAKMRQMNPTAACRSRKSTKRTQPAKDSARSTPVHEKTSGDADFCETNPGPLCRDSKPQRTNPLSS